MTLRTPDKKKVINALLRQRMNYDGSDASFAEQFSISASTFSQLKKGYRDGLISDDNIVNIADILRVDLTGDDEWLTAETTMFKEYVNLFRNCQELGASRMICDKNDWGKTETAKWYMLNGKNVFYLDCSRNKGYTQYVKGLARCMGVPTHETINVIRQRVERKLLITPNPIVIQDEFGDLENRSFQEQKSLWNATEGKCAWVAIGSNSLQKRIQSGIHNDKMGFAETYRRYGSDYMTAVPEMDDKQMKAFITQELQLVVDLNMPGYTVKELLPRRNDDKGYIYSLTRIKERILKIKREKRGLTPALSKGEGDFAIKSQGKLIYP